MGSPSWYATAQRRPQGQAPSPRRPPPPGHFCRHRWRLHRGNQTAVLTLSTNRRLEDRALPYIWVQGSPHLALCVARLFGPLRPLADVSVQVLPRLVSAQAVSAVSGTGEGC